jgi:serine/threonine protein kinase
MNAVHVRPATSTGLNPYKLTGVRVTDQELGHGSYATVLELEYTGLKCAGKKIHELLQRQGDARYAVHRFEEECRLLSQVRHPNIVQFLGIYFHQRVQAPMEFLPTNLTSCIEQYGILPKEISYSILHDVALGLCYLHSQTPPIIHRDLSSNNVLLTPNMTAKISDLGVARILNLTPLQVSRMTQTPGTPAYMPPEVMVANPKYDTSVDEFSYGIMMIHMFSGRWPEPQVGANRTEPDGRLIPVTEAERREVFLLAIGADHPLMDLILKCINNHPRARAHASEIVIRLAVMVLQFPASFDNRLEMLRQIEAVEQEKGALTKDVQQNESQISSLIEEVQVEKEQKSAEIDRLKLTHSSEMEQLCLQVRDLNVKRQFVTTKAEAEIAELKSITAIYKSQIENYSKVQFQEREKFKEAISKQREQSEFQLTREREANQNLQSDLSKARSENIKLQCIIS